MSEVKQTSELVQTPQSPQPPNSPRPGQVWKHYKKPIPYVVQSVREIEELGVWVVVYQNVFFNERPWVLTLDRWHSMVEVDGPTWTGIVQRYTLLFETFKEYLASDYEVKNDLHYVTAKLHAG